MNASTRDLIRRLLEIELHDKRVSRNLAAEQFSLDHPIVARHETEIERVSMALDDFNDSFSEETQA